VDYRGIRTPGFPHQLHRISLLGLANEILLAMAEQLELERHINAFSRTNHLYRYNVQRSGNSALFWAATNGQETTAQNSVSEGADVRATILDSQGRMTREILCRLVPR